MSERRADGFLHRFLNVGEVTLHVAEARPAGIDDASVPPASVPLVVLLHGFPDWWWTWRAQLEALAAAGAWAVAPDLRGYNESDKPRGVSSYSIDKLVADVAGLIRALGRTEAIVVAHDWGAGVAWALASERPEMIRRLAILNLPHPVRLMRALSHPRQMLRSWYMAFFQLPLLPELLLSAGDFAPMRRSFRRDGFSDDEIERNVEALRRPGALSAGIDYYRAAARAALTGKAPKPRPFERPVLVIWGDRDPYLGKELAEPPSDLAPNVRVVHVPDAGHFVQHDAARLVNDLLVALLAEEKA